MLTMLSWRQGVLVATAVLAACAGEAAAPMTEAPEPMPMAGGAQPNPSQPPSDTSIPPPDMAAAPETEPAREPEPEPASPDERPAPTNVSFETAQRVSTDGSVVLQDEMSATQVDYFVFAGEAGAFYEITTDRDRYSPDNVVALYDEEQRLLGENDEGAIWPGDAIDARLIVRAPVSGDYFVRVEDPYTPAAFFASSFPLLYYHLRIRELDDSALGIVRESDSATMPVVTELDEQTGYAYATLVGETGNGDDVFSFDGGDGLALVARVLHAETPTANAVGAWTRALVLDGNRVLLGQIDSEVGQRDLRPPLADAGYELHVTTNDALYGDGDPGFYAIDIVLITDNPAERDDEANDTFDGAEEIAMEGSARRTGLLLSTLPEDDVDWFRFQAEAGEWVTVACDGESTGSRIRGLQAELTDADGLVLDADTESSNLRAEIPPRQIESSGTYYLRLSADTASNEDDSAAWFRCGIRAELQ